VTNTALEPIKASVPAPVEPIQSKALAPVGAAAGASAIEALIIQGDLAKITPAQRVDYYRAVCESLGLNPFTRPFDYISLDGKLQLYVRKDATDQLRSSRGVQILELTEQVEDANGITSVRAHGRDIHGRDDWATGRVFTKGLGGQNLANAQMKAETKAKRRLTLSLVGLGWLDESEIEAARATRVVVDLETGEISAADADKLAAVPTAADRLAARVAQVEAPPASPTPAPIAAEPETGDSEPSVAAGDPDVVECEAIEQPPEQAEAAQPAASAAEAGSTVDPAMCGSPSPFTEGETCRLVAGHKANHRSSNRETWAPGR
jgi:hypothetical protein